METRPESPVAFDCVGTTAMQSPSPHTAQCHHHLAFSSCTVATVIVASNQRCHVCQVGLGLLAACRLGLQRAGVALSINIREDASLPQLPSLQMMLNCDGSRWCTRAATIGSSTLVQLMPDIPWHGKRTAHLQCPFAYL
jgi:hypothetical protein